VAGGVSNGRRPRYTPGMTFTTARGRALALGVLACVALAPRPSSAAAQLFDLSDRAEVVAWGTVERVRAYADGKFQVFDVRVERLLEGDAPPDGRLALVQERLFEGTKPLFAEGTRALVFAVPLPRYTLYREALPEGSYVQWPERLDTVTDLASLRDPELVEPVARYLALGEDPEARAGFLAGLTTSVTPRLREGALAALEARRDLAPLLDAATLAGVPAFLQDERIPLTARGDTLVRLARIGAPGVVAIAEEAAGRGGPLLPAAIDALVTLDRPPSTERLVAYARSDDEALRVAAVRGLVKQGGEIALGRRVAVMVREDPSANVRMAALQALGFSEDDRAVAILADAVPAGDKRQTAAAADSLGRIGNPAAIAALEKLFLEGTYEVQTAVAFALKQSGTKRGLAFLMRQREQHPDPRVQRICKLALGEDLHEH